MPGKLKLLPTSARRMCGLREWLLMLRPLLSSVVCDLIFSLPEILQPAFQASVFSLIHSELSERFALF